MYGMSIYQAPQVPQPAFTFGGGNYVDLSTVNILQAQNAALQQENVALKSANQSLQQQRENPLCKAANRAYLREFTAYKTESLVEFPDGKYYLIKENNLGEFYKVVKPVSDCTEFSARYVIDPRDGSKSIEVQYRLPNGTLSGFRVADDKFQQNALIQGFYKSGGTLRCGKDGPRLFYMLVAQLLSKHEIYFQPIPGWNINASRWFFKESAGCEAPLDSPILRPDALTSEDQMMMAAVIGLSFLKTRLPEDMQPTKPFAVISESFSITTEITLNCKLAELKKQLNHHRDDLLIHVRGGCMAIQFAKQRTPLLALDLGHTLSPDHICPPLSSEFEALAIRHDLYNEPVATDILNPKPCGSNTESPYDTAYGLCQIIGQNNRFGPAQIALLTAEVKTIVERREICPHIFPSILKALKSSTSANVRMLGNRLEPLLQHDVFERRQNGSFSLPISPHIHIFDVSSYPDTIRTTLAELLLYDWFRSARALQIPIVIMIDEVQNLRLGRGTVLNRLITEGRKFSIGSMLISQSLKCFAPDEQLALSQTGTKLFFKPPLTEIRACSEMLAEPVRRSGTVELLKKLKVGQCLLLSDFTYIGDSLQPSSDCIQVSISLPTSIIK